MKKELMQSSNLTKPENAESGRTMVEMLGTLAIIGILSVGGVTGYTRAIKTYRTNSAVETAQRQAAIVAGEVGLGQAVSPGSATVLKASAGYEVAVKSVTGSGEDITTASPYFGVEIGGNTSAGSGTNTKTTPLQSEVAKEMLERAIGEWKNVHAFGVKDSGGTIHWLNSTDSGDYGFETAVGNAKTVIIIIVYASDLSLRPETGLNVTGLDVGGNNPGEEEPGTDTCTEECGSCQKCENGACVTDDTKTDCSVDGVSGTCNEDGICITTCPYPCGACEKCENGACIVDEDKTDCSVDGIPGTCNEDGICIIPECSSEHLSSCTSAPDCIDAGGGWGTGPNGSEICCSTDWTNVEVGLHYSQNRFTGDNVCAYYCDTPDRASCDQISCQSDLNPASYWDYTDEVCREWMYCPSSPCGSMCEKAMVETFTQQSECECYNPGDTSVVITEWVNGQCKLKD